MAFNPTTIDDDSIATYIFTTNDGTRVVTNIAAGAESDIDGPRGTRTALKIGSSLNLRTGTFLFTQLGSQGTSDITSGDLTLAMANYMFIDSTVRVSGVSTKIQS